MSPFPKEAGLAVEFPFYCLILFCVLLIIRCTSCPPSVTTASMGSGTYYEALEVSLTSDPPAEIYYSSNGGAIEKYDSPILILITTNLRFFSVNECGSREKTREESYTIESPFHETASMSVERFNHTSTTLSNGDVLVAGGAQHVLGFAVSSAEIYDAQSGTFFSTQSMYSPRNQHTGTLLMDGSVLVAGGNLEHYITTLSSAELYLPSSDSFSPTGRMSSPRFNHTSTLLNDGTVLETGGATVTWTSDSSGFPVVNIRPISSAEIFSPVTRASSSPGYMNIARMSHTATILTDGTVLIAGGGYDGLSPTSSAEIYNPVIGSFRLTKGRMDEQRIFHSAVLLSNGRVLITGGSNNGGSFTNTAEIYDPLSETFTFTANHMNERRGLHASILLDDGNVLITGGSIDLSAFGSYNAELYNPSRDEFTPRGPMTSRRLIHTMNRTNNGRILICGGLAQDLDATKSCEIYDPYWTP